MKQRVKNILITCAGGPGPMYLAKKLSKKYAIFLVDGNDLSPAPLSGFPFKKIVFGSDTRYPAELKKLVKDWKIDCIVPGADEELGPTAQLCRENPSCIAVLPANEFIELCLNKKKLMGVLHEKNISHLPAYSSIESVKYPAIVKPIYGRGSRGVHTVHSRTELKGYFNLYNKKFNEVVVQSHIAGDEYTVSVIVNNQNDLLGVVPKKILLKKGITRAAVSKRNALIEKVSKKIVAELNPCGTFNVQLKLWKNQVYIFEINPRLSTTSVLTDKAFGNEVELFIRFYNKTPDNYPVATMKEDVTLFRYDENYFK